MLRYSVCLLLLAGLLFSGVANAQFGYLVHTDDDDETLGGSPVSTTFDPDTDIWSRSEMPSDPDRFVFIIDDRHAHFDFTEPVSRSHSSSSGASVVGPSGFAAAVCGALLLLV